jgi:hypothetical protein
MMNEDIEIKILYLFSADLDVSSNKLFMKRNKKKELLSLIG